MSTQSITSQVTPFVSVTELRCYLGTDYTEALGNSIHFTCSTWTNLASGSIEIRRPDDTALVTGTVDVSGGSGTEQEVSFELLQATLAVLGKGRHKLRLVATLGSAEYMLHEFWISVE